MLKGGVIMDVINVEQAKIAEAAGAVAVMALERIPADIRYDGGVARMSDPDMIREIKAAVTIPVMAKARIGHFVEAQILEAIEIDYIDESEVLTMADEENHINKNKFKVPFVCGCRNLGEALRRIAEGAAMLRTKGEAGEWKKTTKYMIPHHLVLILVMRSALQARATSSRPCATRAPCRETCAACRAWTRTSCSWPPRRCRRPTSWSRKLLVPAASPS